jgi:hypothetical protein
MRIPTTAEILQRQNQTISNLKEVNLSPSWLVAQRLTWHTISISVQILHSTLDQIRLRFIAD